MEFISNTTKTIIKQGIKDLYRNLNGYDLEYINKCMLKIIETLYFQYNLDPTEFEYQLIQNNYKDIKWTSTFLLPYLNSDPSELKSFDELYTKKSNQLNEFIDINKEEPQYKFTNLQYGRCKRIENNNQIVCEEIQYSQEHLDDNFNLFIQSLIMSSNKMYVNWLNIIPVTGDDILNNKTYQNTINLINNKKMRELDIIKYVKEDSGKLDENTKLLLGSIYIGDIYNVIRNYFYEEIKEIKLLIFDVIIFPIKKKVTGLNVLNEIFTNNDIFLLKDALNDISWANQTNENQNLFSMIWNNLLKSYNDNIPFRVANKSNDPNSVDTYTISTVSLQRLLKGIIINFDRKYGSKDKILKSGYITIKADDDDMDEDNSDDYNFTNMYESLKSIKPEFIYDFIKEILQIFKTTFYSNLLLNDDKKSIKEADVNAITVKNIYNFAKSFSSYVNQSRKFVQYPKYWCSLENSEKEIILNRLNDNISDVMSWFNIGRYIKSLRDAGYVSDLAKDIKQINLEIYNLVKNNLVRLIFECLIYKGILSTFKPNKTVTDTTLLGNNKVNDLIKSKYFTLNKTNKYANNSYYYLTDLPYLYSGELFNILSNDSWYTMQAMEWVSQLGFCHHYINNRVSYVTGATGVGKSTHVPKLYMYYLKAIDYKSAGKVVCTQPRRTPTERNAEEVSKQMGMPIVDILDIDGRKVKNILENYSVQMQHQDRKHVKNIQQLMLKFVTDGSLLQEFKSSLPICKKMSRDNKKATVQNLYDVIIIDEAHEHNKNMDLLLTLLKIFSFYNPSLRVVILSATMDDDEPTYRRYYRAINDNLKYPYDLWIEKNNIDRINIDRRFHISAPGMGTRFTINEFYKDKYDVVQLVQELIRTPKGDILVFQPGENDIIKLISELNKILPSNWIALPFYSTMQNERRSFIENIDSTFLTLKIDRENDFDKVKSIYEGKGNYTNFVLVATNIAEASITIKRLYYVIDTGTRKSNFYDYKKRNNKLVLSSISETSRLQRKGRVGRTGEGEAYYIYKAGTTTNTKTPYEISIGNISNDIYLRLRNKKDENNFKVETYYEQLKSIYETTKGQYKYIGNKQHNDYDFKEYIPEFYETGFDIDDLIDNYGRFYIVHPEEIFLKRNIYGTIIGLKSDDIKFKDMKSGLIDSKKMQSFVEDYETQQFYLNNEKTELGINITDLMEKFKLDDLNYVKTIIYSVLLGSSDKVVISIILLTLLRGDVMNIFDRDLGQDTPKFIDYSERATSDIEVLINLTEKFLKFILNKSKVFDLDNVVNDQKVKGSMIEYKNKMLNIDSIINLYNNFIEYEDDDLDRESLVDHFISGIMDNINEPHIIQIIETFCDLYGVNEKIFTNFIKSYIKMKDVIKSLNYADKRGKSYSEFITKYKVIFEDKYKYFDKIKLPFVLSQPYNIMYPIIGTDSFLSVYYPTADNIMGIGKTKTFDKSGRKKYINTILFNNMYTKDYCYYGSYNPDRDTASIIIKLDKQYIRLLNNIYNSARIKHIVETHKSKIDKYVQKAKDALQFKAPIPKDYGIIVNASLTYNTLYNDLKN
jgi:hypothetical protein